MNPSEKHSKLNMAEHDASLNVASARIVSSDEIDLRELVTVIWQGRWIVLGVTALFSIIAVTIVLWLPNKYTASATLAPASSSGISGLSQLASQFGGLASLAGINLNGNQDDKSAVAIELLKSWSFIDSFIRENHIEVEVFAAKGWDLATNQLIIDPDLYDVAQKKWVRKFNPAKGQAAEPNSWELYKKFRDMLTVDQDKKTNFVTLSVEYYSPKLAKEWVSKLVVDINHHLQVQDKHEASKSIEYLNRQVGKTSVIDMQTVFYKLIEEQTKNLMLTEVSDEYALKTISPAMNPKEVSSPRRALIVIFAVLFGGIVASAVALVRHACFKKAERTE